MTAFHNKQFFVNVIIKSNKTSNMVLKVTLMFFISFVSVSSQAYEDKRCYCVCPSPAAVFNNSISKDRRFFTGYVPPNKCNCYEVVIPKMDEKNIGHALEFCLRCECKYETRNTTTIMVVVILLLWILTLLMIYLVFLLCLDPLIYKRQTKEYMESGSEEGKNLLQKSEEEEE
ncbi:proton-transporting V-type ATPase complex assembly regulator TMEM9-like [Battus philenor]|uniref:proton-transporting V-type ATPase complex assembly regulator TMEM9-like n=1 Tax=Battus philenor TaxID=42288 RepID=UPI0035CEAF65